MVPGRNDPCPCGSGRKYKQCCLAKDAERAIESADLASPRDIRRAQELMRAAARAEPTWEADVIPMFAQFEDGKSSRPVFVVITAGSAVVYHDVKGRLRGGAEPVAKLLEAAVVSTARDAGAYPEILRVRHPEVARALVPMFAARQVRVEFGEAEQLAEAAGVLLEQVAGVHMWPPVCQPDTWGAWDLPQAVVKNVFAAAARFYREAPWREISNLQAPRALLPSGRSWMCCILGNAGVEFGLAMYERAADLFEVVSESQRPEEPFAGVRGRIVSFTYVSDKAAGSAALREARLGRWEIAGPAAYPQLMTVNTPGGGVTAQEMEDMIALLDALPRYVRAHRASLGREERTGQPVEPIEWQDAPSGITFQYAGEAFSEVDERNLLPADLRAQLEEVLADAIEEAGAAAGADAVLRVANQRLQADASSYNDRARSDLGGLSPSQVHRLLNAEWDAPDSAVQLNGNLSLHDLAHSETLANARTLLTMAHERGGLGLTQAGNLKLDVVRELANQLQAGGKTVREDEPGSRMREQDMWPLHTLRVVCVLAGLLAHRNQRFETTRVARRLLEPAHAGELYTLLFRTWFRKFDISYGRYVSWPELQYQVAYTLCRLQSVLHEWRTADDLLNEVVLPFARDQAPRSPTGHSFERIDFKVEVLDTLASFGLLKRRSVGAGLTAHDEYAVTELMDRFIRFDV